MDRRDKTLDSYLLYFDSGTSNTRAYLLDRDFQAASNPSSQQTLD